MKRLLAALLLAALFAPMASAQGTGAFARLGFGARGAAMGNALVADVFSTTSPFYNPAHAPFATAQHVDATAGFLSLDRELQHAQFAFPLPPRAGAALGLVRAAVDGIDGRDASGYPTGELTAEETLVFAAFGIRIGERVHVGIGPRFYRNALAETAEAPNALAFSLGMTVRASDRLALGLVVDDLLGVYSWNVGGEAGGTRTRDRFPTRVRLGAAHTFADGRLVVSAEAEARAQRSEVRRLVVRDFGGQPQETVISEDRTFVTGIGRLGAEWMLGEAFALRAGIDRLGEDGFEGASPSVGFAVRQALGELSGQAAYTAVLEPYGLGVLHLLSLRLDL